MWTVRKWTVICNSEGTCINSAITQNFPLTFGCTAATTVPNASIPVNWETVRNESNPCWGASKAMLRLCCNEDSHQATSSFDLHPRQKSAVYGISCRIPSHRISAHLRAGIEVKGHFHFARRRHYSSFLHPSELAHSLHGNTAWASKF